MRRKVTSQDRPEGIKQACSDRGHHIRVWLTGRAELPKYHQCMAYDQELAGRIRQLIGSDPDLAEKKMFGGLAFLIRGNMAIAAASQGGAMVRVDPAESDSLVKETAATVVEMRGRQMPGWLHVRSEDLRTDDQLARWVQAGTGYARSLPAK
jgi:hypothetical protein